MSKIFLARKTFVSIVCFIASINLAAAHGLAAITFSNITIPEAPPVASVMAAYMHIKNNTNTKKILNEISSPQFKRVEIHEMHMTNGMMNMKQIQALTIKAQQTMILKPGGIHVMLIKPLKPLKHNDQVTLTFKFASGERTIINTHVQKTD